MSWWKNGLLLGAGGIAGLAIAAWLESENDPLGASRECRREPSTTESIEALMEKIRDEAQWAMDECTTDEQRERFTKRSSPLSRSFRPLWREVGIRLLLTLRRKLKRLKMMN